MTHEKKSDLPYKKAPCNACPMTKGCMKGWLGSSRIAEILSGDTFVCHKDTGMQCAGHMIIRGQQNGFVRLASSLSLPLPLSGHKNVFSTERECIEHHRNSKR